MSHCRECGRSIAWVTLITGRAMPVEPVPDARGNVVARWVHGRLVDGMVRQRASTPVPPGWELYMPHRATCTKVNVGGGGRPMPATVTGKQPPLIEATA
jgi:hypothetical protein